MTTPRSLAHFCIPECSVRPKEPTEARICKDLMAKDKLHPSLPPKSRVELSPNEKGSLRHSPRIQIGGRKRRRLKVRVVISSG